jgi:uncharacterized protein YndB with AHSA1/START domain
MSFKDEFAVHLSADPPTVYRALTDPAALESWLAEHADVDLDAGRYEFWGRHTPDGARGRQRLVAAEPDRLVRFTWTLQGAETTVDFALEPGKEGGTRLVIGQTGIPTMEALMAGQTDRAILWTFWLVPAQALADYLDGRETGPRIDFDALAASKETGEMRVGITIDAPPERVFPYFVEPEKLDRWIGMGSRVDARVGGEIEIHEGQGAATIRELDPPHRLAVGWDEKPGMLVTWELEGSGGTTRLTVVHSGFDDDDPRDVGAWGGWMHGLAQLKRLLETGSVVDYDLWLGEGG